MRDAAAAQQVQINTGMMVVIPAWRLVNFLSEGDPMAHRREIEKQIQEQENRTPRDGVTPSVTGATRVSNDEENP